jgi:hypothetical protein
MRPRRFPIVELTIILLAVTAVVAIFVVNYPIEKKRAEEVAKRRACPSQIYSRLLIHYDKPPIYEEEYRMQDIEGKSAFDYRIRSYNGKQVTIAAPERAMTDVSFFFGRIDQLGVWKLTNQPPVGNTDTHYTIYVKQLVECEQGERTITFTDPHYWATKAGRQYAIDLSKQNPKDLLKMKSTSLADPRYEQIVNEFRTFGPPSFQKKIAAARAAMQKEK